MFEKKMGFGLNCMAALWCLFFFSFVCAFGAVSIYVMQVLIDHDYKVYGLFWMLSFYLILLSLWGKNVFRSGDYLMLAKKQGVELVEGMPSWLGSITGAIRSIFRGRLGEIYVIAKLEGPFLSIFGQSIGPSGLEAITITTDRLDTSDHVGFVFLMDNPIEADVDILIDGDKRSVPQTGMTEIDWILSNSLEGVTDFRASVTFKKEYICLTIIGGVWFGKKFQARIIKGIEIAKKMDEVLKRKYKYKSWDGFAMKWEYRDFKPQGFVLVSESQLSGDIFH